MSVVYAIGVYSTIGIMILLYDLPPKGWQSQGITNDKLNPLYKNKHL